MGALFMGNKVCDCMYGYIFYVCMYAFLAVCIYNDYYSGFLVRTLKVLLKVDSRVSIVMEQVRLHLHLIIRIEYKSIHTCIN